MSRPDKPLCSCGACDWISIPDSLGIACKGCGAILVQHGDRWEPGTNLQQWAADLYESKSRRKP